MGNDRRILSVTVEPGAPGKAPRFSLPTALFTAPVSREVLRLRTELAIGSREEEVVVDQLVELRDVGRQLRRPHSRLERNDLRVGCTDERGRHALDRGCLRHARAHSQRLTRER